MDAKAAQLADAIRSQLGEQVNAPGIRAIKAVLMTDADAVLQSEVLKACGHCSQPCRHQPCVPMECTPLAWHALYSRDCLPAC